MLFGEFTLKSKRKSPYFFDAGRFNDGESLGLLGKCYAGVIRDVAEKGQLEFDMLYGPAYKGIHLVTAVAINLEHYHALNYPWAYNRKEAKDHGEGGELIGVPMKIGGKSRRVLIIDDVITAGTAVRESVDVIRRNGGEPAGVILLLDRQEKGLDTDLSAVQQVRAEFGIPVFSVLTFRDILEHAKIGPHLPNVGIITNMEEYWRKYGVMEG